MSWVEHDDGTRRIPGLAREHDSELIQSWDFAFKDTKTSDYVVGQVWLRRGVDAYLLHQVRRRVCADLDGAPCEHCQPDLHQLWLQMGCDGAATP